MPVTQEELGQRIRLAREACGMTQEEVASAIGLSRPSVAQIEAGRRTVTSLELDRLAYLFGRDIRQFLSEAFRQDDPLVALFRAQPEVAAQPEVVEKLRECLALGRELTNLERLLNVDRTVATASYPLAVTRSRWEAIQQGDRVAHEERRRLGLGWAPLGNIAELLEDQGVRTALVALPADVSGLTLIDPSVGLFVVANRDHHFWRRRFSFAHEYGHVLLDRERLATVSRGQDRDDFLEVRANAFAASFLMPELGVREFLAGLGKGRGSREVAAVFDGEAPLVGEGRTPPGSQSVQLYDLVQVAHHFGVSRLSALYRLKNLRLVSEPEFESLKVLDEAGRGRQVAQLMALPDPDADGSRNEFRHRFLGLALEAYRRDLVSRRKLVEIARRIEVGPAEVEDLLEDTGLAGEGDAERVEGA